MLFGCWGTATLYTVIYIVGFESFIFTKEDEEKFDALLAEMKKEEAGA